MLRLLESNMSCTALVSVSIVYDVLCVLVRIEMSVSTA
jgi:hypothetical protein